MNIIAFALTNLFAELRQSETRLLLFTQWILLVFMLSITLLSSSIQHYLQSNLQNLLGSDVVVSTYQSLNSAQQRFLKSHSENYSETRLITVTLTNGLKYQQVQLKAVDQNYPIQGTLSVGDLPASEHQRVKSGPKSGEIWLESRVLAELNLKIGDSLKLAGSNLKVTKVLFHEPDRLMEGHSVAMRAMVNIEAINQAMISDTVHFRYLLNTSRETDIQQWQQSQIPDATFISRKTSQHPLSGFWNRVENFLGLAGIILFFMAAVAIDSVGRKQVKQESYRQAIYLSLGQPFSFGMTIVLIKWVVSFVLIAGLAWVAALIIQGLLIDYISQTFVGIQATFQVGEVVATILLALLILVCLFAPNMIQLKNCSVVDLLKESPQKQALANRVIWNTLSLTILAFSYSDNPVLTTMMLVVMVATILLITVMTFFTLKLGERLSRDRAGLTAFSFFMMNQRLLNKVTQVMGISLCLTLLIFTLMLMRDIGDSLERNTRVNDGNLFISKATETQLATLTNWSEKNRSDIRQLRPYVRATLLHINGVKVTEFADHPSESLSIVEKPIRLSWSKTIPENNRITQGQWWNSPTKDWRQVSVEDEVLFDLGLNLGDQLTFAIDGLQVDFKIVSTHAFVGGKGSVTFWFQVPEAARQQFVSETFYMGSMELPPQAWKNLTEVWQKHPSLGLVPLKELTRNFDQTLAMVKQLVFGYSSLLILLSLIVIAASIKRFEQDDKLKNGLLLSFGLEKKLCFRLNFIEWSITGAIACIGAIAGTWFAGELIYQSQFNMTYSPNVSWYSLVLIAVVSIITVTGLLMTRQTLNVSVRALINNG